MPELQTSDTPHYFRATATDTASREGLRENPHEVVWARTDWEKPVGHFTDLSVEAMRSTLHDQSFFWSAVRIASLQLSHRAALLLLQGQPLSGILVPNHFILGSDGSRQQLGHVLLRVDPWRYWLPSPVLTGLVLARLGELPDGVSSSEVLAELAQRTAP